jgi:hypothetical protein
MRVDRIPRLRLTTWQVPSLRKVGFLGRSRGEVAGEPFPYTHDPVGRYVLIGDSVRPDRSQMILRHGQRGLG